MELSKEDYVTPNVLQDTKCFSRKISPEKWRVVEDARKSGEVKAKVRNGWVE